MTGKALKVSAPAMSSCPKMGLMSGGRLMMRSGGAISPNRAARAVTEAMPIRIAPFTPRTIRNPVSRKPRTASSTAGSPKFPTCTGAPWTPSRTMPVSFSPMKVRNSPMPTLNPILSGSGTEFTSQERTFRRVSAAKSRPLMKMAPRAVCQEKPSTFTTVKAMKAFSPM